MRQKEKSSSLVFFFFYITSEVNIPFFNDGVKVGFSSPAEDFDGTSIDLNKELITNKSATFFARVKGNSMIEDGIEEGDVLIIDKSLEPIDGKVAVCFIDGEFTVKKIKTDKNMVWLIPANSQYSPIKITTENNFLIWGIVTYVIKKMK
ncbi:MAG: translesion error-prone DNA polymerase V autoproteolytic subunit [Flavobacteriales bacterium]|nr:translesion error-prone DNA polymerase V autoproteolytic subunit [Flavobacteriales bacterium]